jgi:hypothetical protein
MRQARVLAGRGARGRRGRLARRRPSARHAVRAAGLAARLASVSRFGGRLQSPRRSPRSSPSPRPTSTNAARRGPARSAPPASVAAPPTPLIVPTHARREGVPGPVQEPRLIAGGAPDRAESADGAPGCARRASPSAPCGARAASAATAPCRSWTASDSGHATTAPRPVRRQGDTARLVRGRGDRAPGAGRRRANGGLASATSPCDTAREARPRALSARLRTGCPRSSPPRVWFGRGTPP